MPVDDIVSECIELLHLLARNEKSLQRMPLAQRSTTLLLLSFIDECVQGLNKENQLLVTRSSALHACKNIMLMTSRGQHGAGEDPQEIKMRWWPLKIAVIKLFDSLLEGHISGDVLTSVAEQLPARVMKRTFIEVDKLQGWDDADLDRTATAPQPKLISMAFMEDLQAGAHAFVRLVELLPPEVLAPKNVRAVSEDDTFEIEYAQRYAGTQMCMAHAEIWWNGKVHVHWFARPPIADAITPAIRMAIVEKIDLSSTELSRQSFVDESHKILEELLSEHTLSRNSAIYSFFNRRRLNPASRHSMDALNPLSHPPALLPARAPAPAPAPYSHQCPHPYPHPPSHTRYHAPPSFTFAGTLRLRALPPFLWFCSTHPCSSALSPQMPVQPPAPSTTAARLALGATSGLCGSQSSRGMPLSMRRWRRRTCRPRTRGMWARTARPSGAVG